MSFIHTSAMMHDYTADQYNFDRCEDCGHVFLNSRVPQLELGKFYTKNFLPYRIKEEWGKHVSFIKRDPLNIDI